MRCALAIALLLSLPLASAQADVYRSIDAQGHVQYSDTPSPGAELIEQGPSQSSSLRSAASTSTASNTRTALEKSDAQIRDELNQEQQQRAVAQDVAQARAEQCQKAKQAYDQSVQARRIYTTDANGERQYLTDAQADQQRLQNKQAVDELCHGGQ